MAEPGTDAPARVANDAQATLEALARTLPIHSRSDVDLGATLHHGDLAAAIPSTRGELVSSPSQITLPRWTLSSPGHESPGELADLTLVRALGEGGMGVVWLAKQRSLDREVAVKRLKGGAGSHPDADVTALLAEGRATGALEHPSVVPVHALGADEDGAPLLVMKRVDGDSLQSLIADPDHPSWPELHRRYGDRVAAIVEILMRVADALELAHARGIVHRDVKPENIMVGHFGEVYLVDWGIALRLATLSEEERRGLGIVGTPSFMAPEMVRGDALAIDARTDVYLLGATLHAALSGKARHPGETLPKVLLAALLSQPVIYDAEHAELGALANRATHCDPAERPQSALAFREALAGFLRHRGSTRLAQEAQRRLESMSDSPEALASTEATRVLTESRFAFTQALREWPENQPARAGLERTLRKMIEAELLRRSPEGAQAVFEELDGGDDALRERIAGLRHSLVEARALEDAARRDARDRDPTQTARQRAWIAGGLMVLTAVLVTLGWNSEQAHTEGRPMSEVLTYDGVLVGFALLGVALFRRRLLINRLGRQSSGVLLMALVGAGISDAFFAINGASPNQASSSSLLVIASVLGGGALGVDARFGWPAAAFVAGALACALWPSWTVLAVGGASILALWSVLWDALRQARAPEPPS